MTNVRRFQKKLIENGADAALISTEFHQRYLSGFDYSDGYILVTQKKAFLLTDFRYIEAANAEVSHEDFEILMPNGMILELMTILDAEKVKTLLIEENRLSVAQKALFESKFEGVEVLSGASAILDAMREVKTQEELDVMDAAQKITDAAFDHIVKVMTPNMTEIEVALELEFFMRRNGADCAAFQTIAVSGSASSMPHGVPRNVKLERGFLTMDFGAGLRGYCSDMTRTVVIGKADAEIKRVYDTVLKAQLAALDFIKEGIVCRDADKVARDIIDNAGYKGTFGHSLGHGVGMLVHESPRLSFAAPETMTLERGHVVSVEPGIYLPGKYGCRIEDMVAIDLEGKLYNFTKSPKEMIELF